MPPYLGIPAPGGSLAARGESDMKDRGSFRRPAAMAEGSGLGRARESSQPHLTPIRTLECLAWGADRPWVRCAGLWGEDCLTNAREAVISTLLQVRRLSKSRKPSVFCKGHDSLTNS
jgi:hypothetical protein